MDEADMPVFSSWISGRAGMRIHFDMQEMDGNIKVQNSAPSPAYLTCSHLKLKEVELGVTIFSKLVQFNRFPYGKVHVCLICSKNDSRLFQVNINRHYEDTKHTIYMKVSQPCEIYCTICGDYQFCSVFDHRTGRKRQPPVPIPQEKISVQPEWKAPRIESQLTLPPPVVSIQPISGPQTTSIARGLVNMGSTCFMSSVLQVLVHNNDFVDSSQLLQHMQYCPIGNKRVMDGSTCIPCEFGNVARELRIGSQTDGPVVPSSLLYAIWNLINYMVGYAQQDAHEFLLALLNGLECQMPVENLIYEGPVLEKLYSGAVQSTLRCLTCQDISVTKESFVDLSLSLESSHFSNDSVNLTDCLGLFTVEETLIEPMMCEKCNSKQQKSKQLRLIKSPNLLILHLKRFDFLKKRKITKQVNFPVDNINISKFCSETGQSLNYSLLGIVSHEGTLNQGHYISYVKDSENWRKYDDENVSIITEQEVQNCSAYLLFYTRR